MKKVRNIWWHIVMIDTLKDKQFCIRSYPKGEGVGGGGGRHGVTVSTYVGFPSLPPVLLRGFESRLGHESSRFSISHFLKLVVRGFLRVLRFPHLFHRFNGPANKIKLT